jgi:ankyrin repeat protein
MKLLQHIFFFSLVFNFLHSFSMEQALEKIYEVRRGRISVESFKEWMDKSEININEIYISTRRDLTVEEIYKTSDKKRLEWECNSSGKSLLHAAVEIKNHNKRKEIIKFLIKKGIDPEIQTDYGSECTGQGTALHYTNNIPTNNGSLAVKTLLRFGANPNEKNHSLNATPLYIHISDKNLAESQLLLQYGANPFEQNKNGFNAFDAANVISNLDDDIAIKELLMNPPVFNPSYKIHPKTSLHALAARAVFNQHQDNPVKVAHIIGTALRDEEYLNIVNSSQRNSLVQQNKRQKIDPKQKEYELISYLREQMTYKPKID